MNNSDKKDEGSGLLFVLLLLVIGLPCFVGLKLGNWGDLIKIVVFIGGSIGVCCIISGIFGMVSQTIRNEPTTKQTSSDKDTEDNQDNWGI